MYSISAYGKMIVDSERTSAYAEALRQAVRPGAVVAELGTGTGFFAMLACQLGARRVYAIEPDDAINLAREIAVVNGVADRIEFIQERSTRVSLPELADVLISDLRGVLPWFQHHLPSIIDARERLLAPGGVLIPQRDNLWAAVVDAGDLYSRHMAPWDENLCGLNMQPGRRIVVNTWRRARVRAEQLLLEPRRWATIDYATVENPNISAEIVWTVEREGTAHGICVWFDTILFGEVGFSNAPALPELIYGNAFFPLYTPVTLAFGDTVSVRLHVNLVSEDYIWRWETCVLEKGDPERVKADFKQSTFYGVPLSPSKLRKQASSHVPRLNEDGEVTLFILSLMNNEYSVGEIAQKLLERFPDRFANVNAALNRVADLSKECSQ